MHSIAKSSFCLLATFSLVVGLFPTAALGVYTTQAETSCSNITGEYTFVSNESFVVTGPSVERTRTFAYSDSWFTGPASTFNQHLATLSTIACETSVSYFPDAKKIDNSRNSKNVEAFLKALKFEDVKSNAYYNLEKLPISTGVALGHKTIVDNGKEYTLLAIIPRSADYKQEWTGNFTVGDGDIHQGFKAGRDEILRFVKHYLAEHNIAGDVKVWTCGHSRGAALANLTGAFLAAGGADTYLDGVSISPEDVYAYTFATPTTVQQTGATKAELLSVEGGPRTDQDLRYINDTPAAAAPYTGADASTVLSPDDAVFASVHNTIPDYDIITLLPPPNWGFTHFGVFFPLKDENLRDAFLSTQAALDPFIHAEYIGADGTEPGDETIFSYKTLDFDTLEFIDDPTAPQEGITQAQCFAERVRGLTYPAPTYIDYAHNGWQDTLAALAGVYGMNEKLFGSIELWAPEDDRMTAIKAALFSYLTYVAERLAEEQGIEDQNTAAAAHVVELLENLASEPAHNNPATVDDAVYLALKWLANDTDPVLDDYGDTVDVSFTSETVGMVYDAAARALADAVSDDASIEDARAFLYTIIQGCVYGSGTKEDPATYEEAQAMRRSLYAMLGWVLSGEQYQPIIDALADGGSHDASEVLEVLIMLLGPDGATTLDKAADESVRQLLDKVEVTILNTGCFMPGEGYYEDLQGHFDTLDEHAAQLRKILMYLLIYKEGVPCTVENNLRTASTFISQAIKVRSAHYNENYLAWMMAKDDAYPPHKHQLVHTIAVPATCTKDGNIEYWHCSVCGMYFADKHATIVFDAQDVLVQAHGHDWGDWRTIVAPTTKSAGLEQRLCTHNPAHAETRQIPALASHTITYDPNGGAFAGSTSPTAYVYGDGEAITIAGAPVRAGYTFLYWKGSKYQPGDKYTVTKDHTFVAQWKKNQNTGDSSVCSDESSGSGAGSGSSAGSGSGSGSGSGAAAAGATAGTTSKVPTASSSASSKTGTSTSSAAASKGVSTGDTAPLLPVACVTLVAFGGLAIARRKIRIND